MMINAKQQAPRRLVMSKTVGASTEDRTLWCVDIYNDWDSISERSENHRPHNLSYALEIAYGSGQCTPT